MFSQVAHDIGVLGLFARRLGLLRLRTLAKRLTKYNWRTRLKPDVFLWKVAAFISFRHSSRMRSESVGASALKVGPRATTN